jgi:dipeptidyl aminopeptidase/acylaminoacyl peptidase
VNSTNPGGAAEPSAPTSQPAAPFSDLEQYIALPRVSGLALSPDGRRLVTSVAVLDPKRATYVLSLWEVDPTGQRAARRLTRSAKGESGAAFTTDGSLLFVSARPDPSATEDDEEPAALWILPPDGGEAGLLAKRPGGVGGVVTAREAGVFVVLSDTMPAAASAADDAARRKARKERKVGAILHEGYPVRWWDHDLGPEESRLLVGQLKPAGADAGAAAGDAAAELRDLTPAPGRALDEAAVALSPDGRLAVMTWQVPELAGRRQSLAAVSTTDGSAPRLLVDDPEIEFSAPHVSPDGTRLACIGESRSTAHKPPETFLYVVDIASGAGRRLAESWDRWPVDLRWAPDGACLVVTADDKGACPLYRVVVETGEVTRLTADRGDYTDPAVSPDGRFVYALRSAVDSPPVPVRVEIATADQQPVYLQGPARVPALPGRLEEVCTTAEDGTALRAWLVLPEGAGDRTPAPLLLWIHGGPLASWNAWSWRWNPWLAAARGYAVLLPDPALSTGYGQRMIERGWGRWGLDPYTDLMSLTDIAVARADVDADRTAAMGGSFGGYMANWIAGHTDRFSAIVTHASLWALDQFGPTTDAAYYWRREMTEEMAEANSPHRFVGKIRTPVLVIHGDKDYRVPIAEALRLWAELGEVTAGADGTSPHKFLYYPDENHWVLAPQHAKIWYETVFAFLASTVLGQEWVVPDILR